MKNKTKHNFCVKLTEKNIDKVYSILEMFGESTPYDKKQMLENSYNNNGSVFHLNSTYWCTGFVSDSKTLIKPKELKQILAVEHLKAGDIIVVRIDSSNGAIDFITSFSHFHETGFSGKNWVCLDSKMPKINTGTGSFDKFLRFATDEEKLLVEPVNQVKAKEVISPEQRFSLFPYQSYTREVWVNVYKDTSKGMDFIKVHDKESNAKMFCTENGKTVKGTLTYTLDND